MRQTYDVWKIIFGNLEENEEIEILFLDGTNEYCLCFGYELFEDGFKTEREAEERLDEIINYLNGN